MQYKQNSLKRVLVAKKLLIKTAAGILVAAILPLAGTAQVAFAAGDASFSFSSSGSKTIGGTFTLIVSETSTAGDNVNGAQANVSYPTAQLQYLGYTQGVFTLCGQTPTSGAVDDGCASASTFSGKQTVMTVSFKVVGSGSGQVKMLSGSDIATNSGGSAWDGSLTSTSYTFSAAAQSGGGTAKKKTVAVAPSTSKPSSPTSSNSTTTPTKTVTNPSTPPTTTTKPTTTTPAATAALTITVTDSSGKPVKGAKVSVDGQYTAYTSANGKASLSGIAIGSHTVSVTASGKTATKTTLNLAANEDKQVSLKLAAKQSLTPVIYVVLGLLILGGGAVAFLKMRGSSVHGPQFPVSGIVVGSGTPPPAPTTRPTTIRPAGSQSSSPQAITSNQPPENSSPADNTTPKV